MNGRTSLLRELFPLPFVGVVVLLLVLIVLTPNLLSAGAPSAGSLPTEAELIVDRSAGDNVTHFYVKAIGTVRYSLISLEFAPVGPWPPPPSLANASWGNATHETDSLILTATSPLDPVAVNVSASYVDPQGAVVVYVGLFAFDVAGATLYTASYVPAGGAVSSTPVTSLPLTLLLETVPGGVPR